MSIERALIQAMLADGTIAGFVGTTIVPGKLEQQTSLPAIVVTRVGGMDHYDMTSRCSLVTADVWIDIYSETYAELKDVRAAVRDLLSGFRGSLGVADPVDVEIAKKGMERDDFRPEVNDYKTTLEFEIWHREP